MTDTGVISTSSRAVFVVVMLAPLGLGMFGTTMHFIPEPSYRIAAFLVAVVSVVILAAIGWKRRVADPQMPEGLVPTPVKVMFGLFVFVYFFYVCFYVTIPALWTEATGVPVSRDYVIEKIDKSSRNTGLCPYRVELRGAEFVLNDSFCVSEQFAARHQVGEHIRLTGSQTALGFRFLIAS